MQQADRKLADIISAVIDDRLLERLPHALPIAQKQRAFDYFVANADRVADLSRDGLVAVAETLRLHPADWQARIAADFLVEPRQMRLPPAPLIVPPVRLTHRIKQGLCEDLLPTLATGSIDLVLTSPPYATQMQTHFPGPTENEMPGWLGDRLDLAKPALKPGGSLILNLGPVIRDGIESDYIRDCLMELQDRHWVLHQTLHWYKPNAAPLGRPDRLRRSYDYLLWFSLDEATPYCDAKACGTVSQSIGMTRTRNTKSKHPIASYAAERFAGQARQTDTFVVPVGTDKGWPHPSKMPVRLAEMLIKTFAPPRGTVLDPFSGSGTTVIAAFDTGRSGIGIESDRGFYNMSLHRLREAQKTMAAA